MTAREPPRLAAWLLGKLGYFRHNPALAGDLLEEYLHGRSGAWYWRQTLSVIANGMRRNAAGPLLGDFALVLAFQILLDYVLWRLEPVFEYPRLVGMLLVLAFVHFVVPSRGLLGGTRKRSNFVVTLLVSSCMFLYELKGYSLAHRLLDHCGILATWFLACSSQAPVNRNGKRA